MFLLLGLRHHFVLKVPQKCGPVHLKMEAIIAVILIQCWFLRRRRLATAGQHSCKERLLRWLAGFLTS
ncbi:hypothetical protein Y032_0003g1660 [Ancylostoma ceylanicum]|uniref:Uncharacterized protein n=1 Tax=Ancylostoma ceylanicum TaxID=53326 RepID=A0A016W002_9BILA|nr:hypothetical protein Y032_0003g1660 [Ancylostoma ceylanicum]